MGALLSVRVLQARRGSIPWLRLRQPALHAGREPARDGSDWAVVVDTVPINITINISWLLHHLGAMLVLLRTLLIRSTLRSYTVSAKSITRGTKYRRSWPRLVTLRS